MVNGWTEESGGRRARWLAELSAALDEARLLVKHLGGAEGRLEAVELYARIETLRLEVEAIRLGQRYARSEDSYPNWMIPLPWQRRGGES